MQTIEMPLERIQMNGPQAPERGEPRVHFLQRFRFHAIDAPLRVHGRLDEAGLPQHAQVLRHARLRHPKVTLDFSNGLFGRDQQT